MANASGPLLDAILTEALRYTATGEKLTFAIRALKLPADMLVSLVESDSELAPEIGAAAANLTAVVEALERAHEFVLARRDTRLQSIANTLEGGTPT